MAPGPASAHLATVTYSWKTKVLSHLVLNPCHSPAPLGLLEPSGNASQITFGLFFKTQSEERTVSTFFSWGGKSK